jgi:hypothetical protein
MKKVPQGCVCSMGRNTLPFSQSNTGVRAVRESARARGDPGLGQGPEIDDWNGDLGIGE